MNPARHGAHAVATALCTLGLSAPSLAPAQNLPCRAERLNGLYVYTASGFTRANLDSPWVPKAIVQFMHMGGDGTVTTPWVTVANPVGNAGFVIDRVGSNGVYSVNDDCTGSVSFGDGVTHKIFMAPLGDEFWLIQTAGLGGSLNVFQGHAKKVAQR
jgi:hypothetical protein